MLGFCHVSRNTSVAGLYQGFVAHAHLPSWAVRLIALEKCLGFPWTENPGGYAYLQRPEIWVCRFPLIKPQFQVGVFVDFEQAMVLVFPFHCLL
jgi:hypothetical protein